MEADAGEQGIKPQAVCCYGSKGREVEDKCHPSVSGNINVIEVSQTFCFTPRCYQRRECFGAAASGGSTRKNREGPWPLGVKKRRGPGGEDPRNFLITSFFP